MDVDRLVSAFSELRGLVGGWVERTGIDVEWGGMLEFESELAHVAGMPEVTDEERLAKQARCDGLAEQLDYVQATLWSDYTHELERDRLEAYTLLTEFWRKITRYFYSNYPEGLAREGMRGLIGYDLATKIEAAIKKTPLT